MLPGVTCILVDANPANLQELAHFVSDQGVEIVAQLSSIDQLAKALPQNEGLHLVVVNLDPKPHDNLLKLGPLPAQYPSVAFFGMSELVDPALLMDAMHLGVKEFIPLPVQEEKFRQGIERVAAAVGGSHRARVLHLIPTAGGCGATTVACNVAATLAKNGRTLLIDMDLVGGGVAAAFDLRPRYSLADLMDSSAKLDRVILDNALALHEPTGVAILSRPEMPEEGARISGPGMRRLLNVISRIFDYVVIDSQMSVEGPYQTVLRSADVNLLVMQLNVPSARNAERFVAAARRLGIAPDKIRVVVNRFSRKGTDIDVRDVERTIGMPVTWTVPNDFKTTLDAINYGQPVILRAPRAEVSQSLSGLAASLNGRNGS